MGFRQDLEKRIEKKKLEIRDLELQIHAAKAHLQANEESLRALLKEDGSSLGERTLRAGSSIAKARDAIKKAGKPLHIADLLKALGRSNDKKNRLSLSGSLAHYVRRGEIFARPAPNTFGLTEFDEIPEDAGDPDGGKTEPGGKVINMR